MDRVMDIGQREAEETMRALARVEGIFAGAQPGIASCCALSGYAHLPFLHAARPWAGPYRMHHEGSPLVLVCVTRH